ncbi:unnamed protein product [marine sediment metagenome]|uniref:Carbohydrate kinase FGGY N-terminal domain-containing protein n=1 Tax=marine sediment metagenome TaxID=412755 RepID=X1GM27_9ZZZZ
MALEEILDVERLKKYLDLIIKRNAKKQNLIGWVLAKDIQRRKLLEIGDKYSSAMTQAILLESVCKKIPIFIEPGQIFAGTEEDAFSASYALINPAFRIESFQGYNDEMAFYDDVKSDDKIADVEVTKQMVEDNRKFWSRHPFVVKIRDIYKETGNQTKEAVYFVERVTGHTIPGFEEALEKVHESKEVAGYLLAEVAKNTGLLEGIPVVYGGGDQSMQAVGNGVIKPRILSSTIGTGGQLFITLEKFTYDPKLRIHSFCHAIPNTYHLQGRFFPQDYL